MLTSFPTWFLSLSIYLQFHDDGYLIVDDVFSAEECQAIRNECLKIVNDFDISQHPKSIFRTGVTQVIGTDRYFNCEVHMKYIFGEFYLFNGVLPLSLAEILSYDQIIITSYILYHL